MQGLWSGAPYITVWEVKLGVIIHCVSRYTTHKYQNCLYLLGSCLFYLFKIDHTPPCIICLVILLKVVKIVGFNWLTVWLHDCSHIHTVWLHKSYIKKEHNSMDIDRHIEKLDCRLLKTKHIYCYNCQIIHVWKHSLYKHICHHSVSSHIHSINH